MASTTPPTTYYLYSPSHVLPAVSAALVGTSLVIHIWQNYRYKFWRVTFFMFWAGAIFTTGWIIRCISALNTANLNLYIIQNVLTLCGPPIYAAVEYNILGRLMHYLPMHAPLNPNRVVYFFIYLGLLVEVLTSAGAARQAVAKGDKSLLRSGSSILFISVVLQGIVECLFMAMVGLMHYRCVRSKMLTPNVRNIFIMLYGTSTLVLFRCIYRAIEAFNIFNIFSSEKPCSEMCIDLLTKEWCLYAFEAAPMVFYTLWMNIIHPGRFLPSQHNRYLDCNKEERVGPGWIDKRSTIKSFIDLFDIEGFRRGQASYEKFWLQPDNWPVASDGMFSKGTASNVIKHK